MIYKIFTVELEWSRASSFYILYF